MLDEILQTHAPVLATGLRDPYVFDVGVGLLFVVGAILLWTTPLYSTVGGSAFDRRRNLRFIGGLSIAVSLGCWGIATFAQDVEGYRVDPDYVPLADASVAAPAPAEQPAPAVVPAITAKSPITFDAPAEAPSAPVAVPPVPAHTGIAAGNQAGEVFAQAQADPIPGLLHEATQLFEQKQNDVAATLVTAVIKASPNNGGAYVLRGNIYAAKKQWDLAEADFHSALQIGGQDFEARFNLAELLFAQQKYDQARPGFLALERDSSMGELATYKVYLCDLFGGHDDAASRELADFNEVGSGASYYFANVSWSLYHRKNDDAQAWLTTATAIYAPQKLKLYEASLITLGYLSIPSDEKSRLTIMQ